MKKLPQGETELLLKKYGIPFPRQILAKTEGAVAAAARKIGFPVVMKVSSPDIVHKTEAKCVIINIKDAIAAGAAYKQIMKNARKYDPKARIMGVSVFEMVPQGTREVIIGSKHDPQFGPVLMFGLGGVFVEVLRDVSFRIVPLARDDAREMIREIRGYRILEGVRGQGPVNFRLLEDTIMKVSKLVQHNTRGGKRIRELDINPLFIDEKRIWAADVRILV
jgi:acyl-CoA synthetase (NDP forming)